MFGIGKNARLRLITFLGITRGPRAWEGLWAMTQTVDPDLTRQISCITTTTDPLVRARSRGASPTAVREELENILASPMFDASERNRRFLRYVVEETLAERGDRIKGYSIGISVFDREPSFDPQIDPVVRIEAGSLRRSLERYYLTDGRHAKLRIRVPKGHYIPQFEVMTATAPMTSMLVELAVPPEKNNSIFVLPFVSLSLNDTGEHFAVSLHEELIVELGLCPELKIFSPPLVSACEEQAMEALKSASARLVLGGSVRVSADIFWVIARLFNRADNQLVWSCRFKRKLNGISLTQLERDTAQEIARVLIKRQREGA